MTPAASIELLFSRAALRRLRMLLQLAESEATIHDLAKQLDEREVTVYAAMAQLCYAGLVEVSPHGPKVGWARVYRLAPAVEVNPDHLALNAGGVPITIGRYPKEESAQSAKSADKETL